MNKLTYFLMTTLLSVSTFSTICSTAQAGPGGTGGGGAAQGKPATANDILHATHIAKFPLRMWLNASEYNFRVAYSKDPKKSLEENPELAKLFLGPKTIFDVIDQLKVGLRSKEPCYDKNGRPVDGSIHGEEASGPNVICISAKRLIKKLNFDNYEFETAGLILHEASHLLGTTEEEAIKLQINAQENIKKFDLNSGWEITNRHQNAAVDIKAGIKSFAPIHIDGLYKFIVQIDSATKRMGEFLNRPDTGPLSPFRAKDRDLVVSLYMKTENISMYACENDPENSTQSQGKCFWDYDKTFGPNSSLLTSAFLHRLGGSMTEAPELDPRIRKISSLDDLQAELNDVEKDVEAIYSKLEASYGLDTFGFPLIEK